MNLENFEGLFRQILLNILFYYSFYVFIIQNTALRFLFTDLIIESTHYKQKNFLKGKPFILFLNSCQ
jgi:hypothetical protein